MSISKAESLCMCEQASRSAPSKFMPPAVARRPPARIRPVDGCQARSVEAAGGESPGRTVGGATGAGWVALSSKLERKCQSCFENGAIVRFCYCDISAMTLLHQHISQHFSVGAWPMSKFSLRWRGRFTLLHDLRGPAWRKLASALMRSCVHNRDSDRGGEPIWLVLAVGVAPCNRRSCDLLNERTNFRIGLYLSRNLCMSEITNFALNRKICG